MTLDPIYRAIMEGAREILPLLNTPEAHQAPSCQTRTATHTACRTRP
ncbi:hypothetical protein BH24GEM3_BH24GEM3_02080 [soil metagenome]